MRGYPLTLFMMIGKLIEKITELDRERLLVYGSLLLSFMLVVLRVLYTGVIYNFFLVWNVFLAFLPYVFSKRLLQSQRKESGILKLGFWFVIWLLFVPNAAYILSDFIHLQYEVESMIFWFDILMIFSMAFTGLFLGSLSFYNIHTFFLRYIKREYVWPVLLSLSLLNGFGIYAGRFWRWNSWYVLSEPKTLLNDIVYRLTDSAELKNVVFFTIAYGMFQFFTYLMLYVIKGRIYLPAHEKTNLFRKPILQRIRIK